MSSIQKIRRLLNIVERLQSGRSYNTKELADFCNVSRRTIFRDIKTLQDSGISVLFDESKIGYWISSDNDLPQSELTLLESISLMLLGENLGNAQRGIPYLNVANEAAQKLRSTVPNYHHMHVEEFVSKVQVNIGPRVFKHESRQHYERTLEALSARKKIRIRYKCFKEHKVFQTLVSPYAMLFQKRGWHLIGRSSVHRAIRTFHISRIQHSEVTADDFNLPPRFNLSRYLRNAWELDREQGKSSKVVVHFQPAVAQEVAEVEWHATQKITWNSDDSIDFSAEVDGIREISSWILGYGMEAKVLKPQNLVELIENHISQMIEKYPALKNRIRENAQHV